MPIVTPRYRLAALSAACLLSVALPAAPAWAQKSKSKGAPAETQATIPASEFTVEIPQIDAVGANVDEATLRDIFSGNLVDNADALAGLTATSITIPTITIAVTTTVDDETVETALTFSDLALTDVAEGVAASVSLAGMTMDAGENGTAEMLAASASNFDIGGVLGIYGLVDAGGQTELETIYTDFTFEGGSFEAPEIACTIGPMSVGEFKARPLAYSFADMIVLVEQLEEGGDEPPPELVGQLLRMYADIFTAFESSPATFGGFDCDGVDDDGRPLTITIAGGEMGGMKPGLYPAISFDGMSVAVEGDGSVSLGNIAIKEMDLSGPIAAINAAPQAIDAAWLEDNARALIPAFAGFSFADLAIDIPDPDTAAERIKASIGAFDLSLSDYLNGIPTDVATGARNIVIDLPANSTDEQIQQLVALGITSLDAGFGFAATWNAEEQAIAINDISVSGVDLATIRLNGTIANATEALFGLDEEAALAAAMGVAISSLTLDVNDHGLTDIIMAAVSAEQGADPAVMRPVFAGLAEGTIVGMLAGAAEAQKVGAAISQFVGGQARNLTIELTAKEPPGLGMVDFMAAEQDPSVLIGKVNISATAK